MISETKDFSITSFVKDLIPIIDTLDRAISHKPESTDPLITNLITGVEMTRTELNSVLSKHGIETIIPNRGEKFDYNLHYAVLEVENQEYPKGSVLYTMQIGYAIKERLIRSAMVSNKIGLIILYFI